jgi:hypothetical protein
MNNEPSMAHLFIVDPLSYPWEHFVANHSSLSKTLFFYSHINKY